MNRKRTLALLTLLLLIIVACVLLRATALTPSEVLTEETETEIAPNNEVTEEAAFLEEPEENPVDSPTPVVPPSPIVITPAPEAPAGCYVGGCSSHICSENPDVMSTCEWRESYACYQTATCERQTTGECDWTETPALNSCLLEAKSNTTITF